MNGAEYIAEFLNRQGVARVHCLTGGACAFLIDAVARHEQLAFICHQHEQSAAMAGDAVWRTTRRPGAVMATSGPGATNLVTGIACSYFDSVPTIFITGQVNLNESEGYRDAQVRQRGFQDTKIVEMVAPITNYAVQVTRAADLETELPKAWAAALSGRMGPVLIDVPINVQYEPMPDGDRFLPIRRPDAVLPQDGIAACRERIAEFLGGLRRPTVVFGAGVGLAGSQDALANWLDAHHVPFVASWNGMTYFDHDLPDYCGGIGVYGNRGANAILQNSDGVLVVGSRLDNRQRSGNARTFLPGAKVHVIDVDAEELKKYRADGYAATQMDLIHLPALLEGLAPPAPAPEWRDFVARMKERYFRRDISSPDHRGNGLSPYAVVDRMSRCLDSNAIVIGDTGATVCWLFQMFHRRQHDLFTAGGHSPMGYALPAAIGAALEHPGRQVIAVTGDGGFQLNLQELQTVRHYNLDVSIVVFNNAGYGIIKQFQDSYLGSRYAASGEGYSCPDFEKIAAAYGLGYLRVSELDHLTEDCFDRKGGQIIDVTLDPRTAIEPKLEMGRPINDQYPYMDDAEFRETTPFVTFTRPG